MCMYSPSCLCPRGCTGESGRSFEQRRNLQQRIKGGGEGRVNACSSSSIHTYMHTCTPTLTRMRLLLCLPEGLKNSVLSARSRAFRLFQRARRFFLFVLLALSFFFAPPTFPSAYVAFAYLAPFALFRERERERGGLPLPPRQSGFSDFRSRIYLPRALAFRLF